MRTTPARDDFIRWRHNRTHHHRQKSRNWSQSWSSFSYSRITRWVNAGNVVTDPNSLISSFLGDVLRVEGNNNNINNFGKLGNEVTEKRRRKILLRKGVKKAIWKPVFALFPKSLHLSDFEVYMHYLIICRYRWVRKWFFSRRNSYPFADYNLTWRMSSVRPSCVVCLEKNFTTR